MGLMYYKPLDGSDPFPIAVGAQGPEGPEGPQGPPGDATKEYVDQQDALKVSKAGDTMTGPLIVPTPTADGHAATKGYVDGQLNARLPDGVMVQSGRVTTGPDGRGAIAYAQPFAAPPVVTFSGYSLSGVCYSIDQTAAGCTVVATYVNETPAAGQVCFVAIGVPA